MTPLAKIWTAAKARILAWLGKTQMPVGTWIATGTKAVGIPPCSGCGRREVWINGVFGVKEANELLPCQHRGRIHSIDAKSGEPVFVCARFGNCTLIQRVRPLPTCEGCKARTG